MATFDTDIPLSFETNLQPTMAKNAVVMHDNSFHIESFSDDAIIPQAQIVCRPLTESQRDAVMTFYGTNKNLVFTFNDPNDGENYSLYFVNEPKPQRIPEWSPPHYAITLSVMGAKQ